MSWKDKLPTSGQVEQAYAAKHYPSDRVVPVLPTKPSNDLASKVAVLEAEVARLKEIVAVLSSGSPSTPPAPKPKRKSRAAYLRDWRLKRKCPY